MEYFRHRHSEERHCHTVGALCDLPLSALHKVSYEVCSEGDHRDHNTLICDVEAHTACEDTFVALTGLDEENILLSLYAKSVGDAKLITKINRVDYDDVIKHLDLDSTVYPKSITADIIVRYARAMKNTMGSNVETMYNVIKGKVEASEFIVRENSPIVGIPISQLKFKKNVLVASISRGKEVIVPRGQTVIETGDAVVIVSGFPLRDIADVLK